MLPEGTAAAFNEWMRRYIEEPERFEAEFRTVTAYQRAEANGEIPSYGTRCVAYLNAILTEQQQAA